jgi:peptidoglycan L-alanyl-D-glutamate endopeptidase CwlK
MASRRIDDLRPDVADACRRLVQQAQAWGIRLLVYCTYRDGAEQDQLYAKGRRGIEGERIVTNARAGESPHNATTDDGEPEACAFDCVPTDDAGKPLWGAKTPEECERWQRLGVLGEELGLRWGGRWKMRDLPHFQASDWRKPKPAA